jgi:hypothetical protein
MKTLKRRVLRINLKQNVVQGLRNVADLILKIIEENKGGLNK